MDHGERLALRPGQRSARRSQCANCATALQAADRRSARAPDYVDDDVVVIRGPEFKGLVVLPRLHVITLEALSISSRASVLAAVQRAARAVRAENSSSAACISVLTDLLRSEGHMCMRVLPSDVDNAMDSSSRSS